ncbi:MAG: MFS transporter [Candidatus Eremiobacteraeota bacterium]|nr:MFS transporter [Candidatus Eremiobacteraeota bacterium]
MRRLPKAIVPIFGTTFADTLGITLMIPLLPVVMQEYHLSDVAAGALLSIPAFCSVIAAPIWGKLSDRWGRKPIVIVAQVLSLIGYVMIATSHSIFLIFLSRIISGCGGGSLGAVQSYIADVTEEGDRDFAFSSYGAVFGMAFIVGPVISGFLMKHGLAIPFLAAAGLEAFNIVFTAFFLPRVQKQTRSKTSIRSSLKAANAPGVRIVLVRQFLAILAIVCFLANFGLYLQHLFHEHVANVSWLLALAGVAGGAAMIFIVTPLSSRIGDRWVAQIGLILSVGAYAMLAFVNGVPAFCGAVVVWAVGSALVEPTLTALLSVRASAKERGAIMGLSDSINSLAMIVGPAAGAALIGVNPRYLGIVPAAAAALALLLGRPGKFSPSTRESARSA